MEEAEKGIQESNAPFGAVITDAHGTIIATAYNTTKTDNDPTAHAEINALREVGKKLGTRDLKGYLLFSNAESCSMCMSAAIKAGITQFYFGAPSEKHMNPFITVFDIQKHTSHPIHIETGILKDECIAQIQRGREKQVSYS
jgi:tRNA(adenine34) deaminase